MVVAFAPPGTTNLAVVARGGMLITVEGVIADSVNGIFVPIRDAPVNAGASVPVGRRPAGLMSGEAGLRTLRSC